MPIKLIPILLITLACSKIEGPHKPHAPKEFAPGEIIMATELLSKIFDNEMAPLECVPDADEASLLLRTIRPRMDVVQDDIEAVLDSNTEITKLINGCEQNCTCSYLDELFREHLVTLSKEQRKQMESKKTAKEVNRCLAYVQSTFCKSELYQELNKEKADFSFGEEAP